MMTVNYTWNSGQMLFEEQYLGKSEFQKGDKNMDLEEFEASGI